MAEQAEQQVAAEAAQPAEQLAAEENLGGQQQGVEAAEALAGAVAHEKEQAGGAKEQATDAVPQASDTTEVVAANAEQEEEQAPTGSEQQEPEGTGKEGATAASPTQAQAQPAVEAQPVAEPLQERKAAPASPAEVLQRNLEALGEEMREFAARVALTESEAQGRLDAVDAVEAAAQEVFGANPRLQVRLFGSAAHGVGFRRAAVDMALAGMMSATTAGGGVTPDQHDLAAGEWHSAPRAARAPPHDGGRRGVEGERRMACDATAGSGDAARALDPPSCLLPRPLTGREPRAPAPPAGLLRRLADELAARHAVKGWQFVVEEGTRLPVLKASCAALSRPGLGRTDVEMTKGVRVCISMASDPHADADAWLAAQEAALPALLPLALTVRALLAEKGLSPCSSSPGAGAGLGAFPIALMALALLQEQQKASLPADDPAHMLTGFLRYYGRLFHPERSAVAAGHGGIVERGALPAGVGGGRRGPRQARRPRRGSGGGGGRGGRVAGDGRCSKNRLSVVDPITGIDLTGGPELRLADVKQVLSDAASKLDLLLQQASPPPGGFLPLLFDTAAAADGFSPPAGRGAHGGHVSPAGRAQHGGGGPNSHGRAADRKRPAPEGGWQGGGHFDRRGPPGWREYGGGWGSGPPGMDRRYGPPRDDRGPPPHGGGGPPPMGGLAPQGGQPQPMMSVVRGGMGGMVAQAVPMQGVAMQGVSPTVVMLAPVAMQPGQMGGAPGMVVQPVQQGMAPQQQQHYYQPPPY
eukprot:scaffold12.g8275.t1